MKIPKHIRRKLRAIAVHSNLAEKAMRDVEDWLEKAGFDIEEDGLRDGGGCSLEELEFGNDISDEICERLERMKEEG